ncbi:Uncharacterised protein [Salmonella enterica subsp. enterica serovar Bovismorbificans]|uniref:Uncharacterized protein n=1 Tax=Salmonella enterica subsp. enterica serovar Bovismorbificans TaxID=58097 RepID=A0A655D0S8_SALET|nr:Uncharacterised protein [Salmonella enterica subsp. enterica serovar Bovismorbificans]
MLHTVGYAFFTGAEIKLAISHHRKDGILHGQTIATE